MAEVNSIPEDSVDLSDLFTDATTKPESNWAKFEKVGDGYQGTLIEEPQYNVQGKFGLQNIYVIETADGNVINIGLKPTSKRAVMQLKQAEVGDVIAIRFVAEIDTGKVNPAKSLEVRIRHVDTNSQMEEAIKESGI